MIHSDAQRNLTKFDKIKECIRSDQLMLKNGESVDIITNACKEKTRPKTMPVMQGRIGEKTVITLRDTGCNGAVVKQKFVNESQDTGRFAYMVLADNTLRKAPIVKLIVQTPFYCGEIQAIAPPDAVYDLIIGNVEGAREPNDPDLNWDRTENNMEVKHTESIISAKKDEEETKISASSITKDDLIKLQKADSIIHSKISNNSKDTLLKMKWSTE